MLLYYEVLTGGTMREERVFFSCGDLRLEGLYCSGTYGRAVICHPHPKQGGSMQNNVVEAATRAMLSCGLATLRFNFRGVGASEGSFGGGVDEIEDVKAAVSFLETLFPYGPLILGGYSFGAKPALLVGSALSSASGLVGIAPPITMMYFDFLKKCMKRILVIVGDEDLYCPLKALRRLIDPPASHVHYTVITGADHFFVDVEDRLFSSIMPFVKGDPLITPAT